jgi:hypothetical protein
MPAERIRRFAAALFVLLAVSPPAMAQGRGNSGGNAKTHGKPPSRTELPTTAAFTAPAGSAPFAWIDDATLLDPGTVWLGISAMRWQGTGVSETDAPIVDVAVGFTPRLQFGASVPRVVGSADPTGPAGGLGTSYFNAKVGLRESGSLRVAVTPTLQILNPGALETTSESRTRLGLPLNVEYDVSERARVYGGSGYFSNGVWFAGGGMAGRPSDRVGVSLTISSAWSRTTELTPAVQRRNEITGGVSFSPAPSVGVFGAVGRTFATTDDNGAGTTLTGGVSFAFAARRSP